MGALIMTHSDDNGLVLPPHLAPIQVVIIPIYKGNEELEELNTRLQALADKLRSMGISVKYDNADNKRPGFKFADYELKGVPVRLVMGARDLANGSIEVMRRDTLEKETRPVEGIEEYVAQLLEEIQTNLFTKAKAFWMLISTNATTTKNSRPAFPTEDSSSARGTVRLKPRHESRKRLRPRYAVYRSA